jgi:hypothetical protein
VTREELIVWFQDHRWDQHRAFFAHRHVRAPSAFHEELVNLFWSNVRRMGVFAFRGSAKSTIAEEFVTLGAAELAFRNCVFVGASEGRAAERIAAVARELERNEELLQLYGEQVGQIWTQTKLVTRNSVCIQALGKDQDIRGIKFLDWRPDLVIVDDFEDRDNVATPEGRRKTFTWFRADLLPACQPTCKIRVLSTPLDPESVPMRLTKLPGWTWHTYPIVRLHPQTGEEEATWPDLFPVEWIERERDEYHAAGQAAVWAREFMCEAVSTADQIFRTEMLQVVPTERTWQAVYAMIDPARSVRVGSATTGWAVWSWERRRLIVWDADAAHLLPDAIVNLAFRIAREFNPIEVGIEEDGLNEWLSQPMRHEQARRGQVVPYRAVKAPRGKLDFIRGLQPFFANSEVVFARELPELRAQLLGFPTGRIDAPNALAYSLLMRPGRLVYDEFKPEAHVRPADPAWGHPCWLAANADGRFVSCALVQHLNDQIVVLGDWVCEGRPEEVLLGMVREASLLAEGARLTLTAGDPHWQPYDTIGLVPTARALGLDTRPAGRSEAGRTALHRALARQTPQGPAFVASPLAQWTLNALAGGFSRPLIDGIAAAEPIAGRYKTLIEGIEALAGLYSFASQNDDDRVAHPNWSFDPQGRRYLSAGPIHQSRRTRSPPTSSLTTPR